LPCVRTCLQFSAKLIDLHVRRVYSALITQNPKLLSLAIWKTPQHDFIILVHRFTKVIARTYILAVSTYIYIYIGTAPYRLLRRRRSLLGLQCETRYLSNIEIHNRTHQERPPRLRNCIIRSVKCARENIYRRRFCCESRVIIYI